MKFTTVVKALCLAMLTCVIIGEETAPNKGEAIGYVADVRKVLDILVNSLYTNRDIFLREVISNASDALDKIRFLYLTNPKEPMSDGGAAPTMDIRITVDKEKRHFVMRDGGVGMTKTEMESALGSLGTSGTKKFLENMQSGDSSDGNNFIGQFGVGFYSVFLVAENVRVASKNDDSEKQWVWESTGDGTYFLYEDPRGNTLGRGTELTLELKKDSDEFLDSPKIREVVSKYSEFITFPIMLGEKQDNKDDTDPTITLTDFERLNQVEPIWTRTPSKVTDEEYIEFYKSMTRDYTEPMYWTHFTAEGEVEFKALLFLPGRAPSKMYDDSVVHTNIRLYVRRVFITDEFKDLLPRYLDFIKGVVDSDDLPLNVSREVLQESRILKIIKKKLVRKALGMLQDIADKDKELAEAADKEKSADESEEKEAEEEDEGSGAKKQTEVLYPTLWEEFGKALRLGLLDDGTNRARLTKLLRYRTSKSEGKLVSLEEYVDRMPENQKDIYFVASESEEKITQMPAYEDAVQKKVEVLFMVDPIDEYVVGHVTDFAGKKLVNLAKDGGVHMELSEMDKKINDKRRDRYKTLLNWMRDLLSDRVKKVKLTSRYTTEPLILSTGQHDVSANMVRLNRGSSLGKNDADTTVKGILEVNHLHPLVDEVFRRVKDDEKDEVAKSLTEVLFEVAAMQNGFMIPDTKTFGNRVGALLRKSVDIAVDADLVPEDNEKWEREIEEEGAAERAAADAAEKEETEEDIEEEEE